MGSGATALKNKFSRNNGDAYKPVNEGGGSAEYEEAAEWQTDSGFAPADHEDTGFPGEAVTEPWTNPDWARDEDPAVFTNENPPFSLDHTRPKEDDDSDPEWDRRRGFEDDLQMSSAAMHRQISCGSNGPLDVEEPDPYLDLIQHRLYHGVDPFKYLTNAWLEGEEPKALFGDNVYLKMGIGTPDDIGSKPETTEQKAAREAAEEAEKKKAFEKEADILRMEELVTDKGDGWKLWLRGRDFRSEFKVQPQLTKSEEKAEEFKEKHGNTMYQERPKPRPRTISMNKTKHKWVRAPVDTREPKGQMVCWRADFVSQALTDATTLGLERPTIAAEKLRELARKDWQMIDLFYWYVEAVDLDGNRELWSPTFVGYLWEYWQRSFFGDAVRMSEAALEDLAASERYAGLEPLGITEGLFPRKPVEWPKKIWRPPVMKVPEALFKRIEQPGLPPLPLRFQHNLVCKDGQLERNIATNLDGSEAWDAMLGTSSRLQAAARAALRNEKVEAALQEERAERKVIRDALEAKRLVAEAAAEYEATKVEAAAKRQSLREERAAAGEDEKASDKSSEEEEEKVVVKSRRVKALKGADKLNEMKKKKKDEAIAKAKAKKGGAKDNGQASSTEDEAPKAKAKPKPKPKRAKAKPKGKAGSNMPMMIM